MDVNELLMLFAVLNIMVAIIWSLLGKENKAILQALFAVFLLLLRS